MRICEAHAAGGDGLSDQSSPMPWMMTAEGKAAAFRRTNGMTTTCGNGPAGSRGASPGPANDGN